MALIQRYALFVDYQNHFLQWLPKEEAVAFRKSARALADDFREKGIKPIWVLMQYSHGASYRLPPRFVPAEKRDPYDVQERALFHKLFFAPDLIRDDEGFLVKFGNNAVTLPHNPMLEYFALQGKQTELAVCGTNTTQCIASTLAGVPLNPYIHRCTALIDHLADMNFDREGRQPPEWHQQRLFGRVGPDKSKISFMMAADYLARLTPYS